MISSGKYGFEKACDESDSIRLYGYGRDLDSGRSNLLIMIE